MLLCSNPYNDPHQHLTMEESSRTLFVHAGWFEFQGRKVVAFLDDASRYILAIREFNTITPENAISTLKEAESQASSVNSTIVIIDRVSPHFLKKEEKSEFQSYLATKGIKSLPSTDLRSGKFTRWVKEYKKHRHMFQSAEEFGTWYNRRIHGALDLKRGETPIEAFNDPYPSVK